MKYETETVPFNHLKNPYFVAQWMRNLHSKMLSTMLDRSTNMLRKILFFRALTISKSLVWTPPATIEELYGLTAGNKFASINRPTSGAREEKDVSKGKAPFQLYSLATPNGQKVGIILEELGIDYDAHFVSLSGNQFTSGFVQVNPNSKIPAAVDYDTPDGEPIHLFESGSIMLYLAEKYNRFILKDVAKRAQVINWLFWQMAGQGPMTGQFGHFFVYAPDDKIDARNYGVARYGMEVQRLCSVLNNHLEGKTYLVGEEYTIADMAIYTWFQQLRNGYIHSSGVSAGSFLNVNQYQNAIAWADRISERPAVQRGVTVCSAGKGKPWLDGAAEKEAK